MKHIVLLILILMITACGKSGGGSPGTQTNTSQEPISSCNIKPTSTDPVELAVFANKARSECGLSEEQVIVMLEKL